MGRKKGKFTAEFRDEAVQLVMRGGKGLSATARDLGLGTSTLQNWVTGYRAKNGGVASVGEPNHFQLQEENRQLREQNRRLQMERDILKKATAFFVNENK